MLINKVSKSAFSSNGKISKGVIMMTVSTQVKQTLAVMKGIQASIIQFAETAQSLEAKEVWQRQIPIAEKVTKQLEKRIQKLERQEPQYKGF